MPDENYPERPWLTVGAEVYEVMADQARKVKVLRFTKQWVVVQSGLSEQRYRLRDLHLVGNHNAWTKVPHLIDPGTEWAQVAFWRQRFKARLGAVDALVKGVAYLDGNPELLAEQLRGVEAAVTRAALWINEHPDMEKED